MSVPRKDDDDDLPPLELIINHKTLSNRAKRAIDDSAAVLSASNELDLNTRNTDGMGDLPPLMSDPPPQEDEEKEMINQIETNKSPAQTHTQPQIEGDSSRRKHSSPPSKRYTTWLCDSCFQQNDASRSTCSKCDEGKLGSKEPSPKAIPQEQPKPSFLDTAFSFFHQKLDSARSSPSKPKSNRVTSPKKHKSSKQSVEETHQASNVLLPDDLPSTFEEPTEQSNIDQTTTSSSVESTDSFPMKGWICDGCFVHNYVTDFRCSSCNEEKLEEKEDSAQRKRHRDSVDEVPTFFNTLLSPEELNALMEPPEQFLESKLDSPEGKIDEIENDHDAEAADPSTNLTKIHTTQTEMLSESFQREIVDFVDSLETPSTPPASSKQINKEPGKPEFRPFSSTPPEKLPPVFREISPVPLNFESPSVSPRDTDIPDSPTSLRWVCDNCFRYNSKSAAVCPGCNEDRIQDIRVNTTETTRRRRSVDQVPTFFNTLLDPETLDSLLSNSSHSTEDENVVSTISELDTPAPASSSSPSTSQLENISAVLNRTKKVSFSEEVDEFDMAEVRFRSSSLSGPLSIWVCDNCLQANNLTSEKCRLCSERRMEEPEQENRRHRKSVDNVPTFSSTFLDPETLTTLSNEAFQTMVPIHSRHKAKPKTAPRQRNHSDPSSKTQRHQRVIKNDPTNSSQELSEQRQFSNSVVITPEMLRLSSDDSMFDEFRHFVPNRAESSYGRYIGEGEGNDGVAQSSDKTGPEELPLVFPMTPPQESPLTLDGDADDVWVCDNCFTSNDIGMSECSNCFEPKMQIEVPKMKQRHRSSIDQVPTCSITLLDPGILESLSGEKPRIHNLSANRELSSIEFTDPESQASLLNESSTSEYQPSPYHDQTTFDGIPTLVMPPDFKREHIAPASMESIPDEGSEPLSLSLSSGPSDLEEGKVENKASSGDDVFTTVSEDAASLSLREGTEGFALQIASDLHLEFFSSLFYSQTEQLVEPNAPVLALLGDIGCPGTNHARSLPRYKNFLYDMAEKFEHVLVISGNHEYYINAFNEELRCKPKSISEIDEVISEICAAQDNLHYLNRKSVVIGNARIIGATLWANIPEESEKLVQGAINDYNLCYIQEENGDVRSLTVEDTREFHRKDVGFIEAELLKAQTVGQEIIVLTHHAPTFNGTSDPNHKRAVRHAFATNLEHLFDFGAGGILEDSGQLGSVNIWAHGHTHWSNCLQIGSTSVLSNQHGYKGKRKAGCLEYKNNFTTWIGRTLLETIDLT